MSKPKLINYLNDGKIPDLESGKRFGLYEYNGKVVVLHDYPVLKA
jgi:hypothetical protein